MPPKSINLFASAIAAAMTLHAACALAAEPSSMTDALKKVEHEWAHIMYQVTDKDALRNPDALDCYRGLAELQEE